MKVLVLGSGGREHAIVRALKHSRTVTAVHVAPGNDGMKDHATVHPIALSKTDELASLYREFDFDLIVIGPDQALADGLSDFFRAMGAMVFGPSKEAAKLEWSKNFAKEFMTEAGLPTASYKTVTSVEEVERVMNEFQPPWVIKADGLALGKGVYICSSPEELGHAAEEIFVEQKFGDSGKTALIEEFKPGWELSLHVLTDGKDYQIFPFAQDHKRLLDGNKGPNTGGMGTIAPVPIDKVLEIKIINRVVIPAINEIKKRKLLYRGILFIGLMICEDEPYVLEFNSRFGDPEAQVFMPLLRGDWGDVFMRIAIGDCPVLHWNSQTAACVVLAAQGYPEAPKKDVVINGDIASDRSSYFLHAGTRLINGRFVTNGGRVLNAIGIGENLKEAVQNAYMLSDKIRWEGLVMRHDIGKQFTSSS